MPNPRVAIPRLSSNQDGGTGGRSEPQAYRRSRSGCFTCRLRRKKCDETHPECGACTNLNLTCWYKRPDWWGNNTQKLVEKDRVKERIQETKLLERQRNLEEAVKRAAHPPTTNPQINFSQPPAYDNPFPNPFPPYPSTQASEAAAPEAAPGATTSSSSAPMAASTWPEPSASLSISALQPPRLYVPNSTAPGEDDGLEGSFGQPRFNKNGNVGQLKFQDKPLSFYLGEKMEVNLRDQPLVYHFVDHVLPMMFPILDIHREGPGRAPEILYALETNSCYYYCCLSASALHMKSTMDVDAVSIDREIVHHRYRAVSELTTLMHEDNSHNKVLDAILAMILLYCSVGETDDYLPDIPWTEHLDSIVSLVGHLGLMSYHPRAYSPLALTISSWVDILGATMLGQTPQFASEFRDRHIRGRSIGLKELMGCEDRVMYLISEIASLEGLKTRDRLSHRDMRHHIGALRAQIDHAEPRDKTLRNPSSATGVVDWDVLSKNITTMFRVAARIYLYSLEPGFDHTLPQITSLVTIVAETLRFIPTGPFGFDRSLVWPLLIAGAYSTPNCAFRDILAQRSRVLGPSRTSGSFGRMNRILQEVWRLSDDPVSTPAFPDSGAHLPAPGPFQDQPAATSASAETYPGPNNYFQAPAFDQAQPVVTSPNQPALPLPSMYPLSPNPNQSQFQAINQIPQEFPDPEIYMPSPNLNQNAAVPTVSTNPSQYVNPMSGPGKKPVVHWRDVMVSNRWFYLLI